MEAHALSKPCCGSVVELAVQGHWYDGAVAATVADTMGAAYTSIVTNVKFHSEAGEFH